MRLHAEVTMMGDSQDWPRPVQLLVGSAAGFLFWSMVIAAVRQIILLL